MTGPNGIVVLPASTGISQPTVLTEAQQLILQEELERLASTMDVLLIDTGAGISSTVTYFAAAAQSIVVVVSPEPTSLTGRLCVDEGAAAAIPGTAVSRPRQYGEITA